MTIPTDLAKNLILYADDDSDDRTWVSEACKILNCSLKINFVENGRQVIDYLKSQVTALPSLIVLDLNMPEMDGRQTLQYLKSNPSYKKIPVAIVSTSAITIDKEFCKRLGASFYVTKPNMHAGWQGIIRHL